MSDPRADVVARQYEKWTYPDPIEDLDEWVKDHWEFFDPSHAQRLIWPDRQYRADLDILVAGCGTNQAATYAYMNRDARITAVDISQSSLNHQQYLKDKHGLDNLELHRLPIEELPTLGRDFDYIVSTGVLHHMADPTVGINTLAGLVRPDGVIGLMLYAKYGRTGVHVLQSAFRDMGLVQDEESVAVVREALRFIPKDHLVRGYLNISKDWRYDAGLVDTFLHGREETYTTDDCVDFVEGAGLVFADWLDKAPYYPHEIVAQSPKIMAIVRALPKRKVWSVMDRLRSANGIHMFFACKPERPKSAYTIDFSTQESLDYVPHTRLRCGLNGKSIFRPHWSFDLDETQLAFARLVDGRRSIREIAAEVRKSGVAPEGGTARVEKYARNLFDELWRLDFYSMAIPPLR